MFDAKMYNDIGAALRQIIDFWEAVPTTLQPQLKVLLTAAEKFNPTLDKASPIDVSDPDYFDQLSKAINRIIEDTLALNPNTVLNHYAEIEIYKVSEKFYKQAEAFYRFHTALSKIEQQFSENS